MTFDWRLFLILLAWLFGAGVLGCASPRTTLQAGPFGSYFKFHNSKDVSVQMENVEVDPDTKRTKIGKMSIEDMASPVRLANVEQIRAGYEGAATLFPQMLNSVMTALPQMRQFAVQPAGVTVTDRSPIQSMIEQMIADEIKRRIPAPVQP